MSKEYWVIKYSDVEGDHYVLKDKDDSWDASKDRIFADRFSSIEDCKNAICGLKSDISLNKVGWVSTDEYYYIRPVKVTVKPANLPKIKSVWEYSSGECLVVVDVAKDNNEYIIHTIDFGGCIYHHSNEYTLTGWKKSISEFGLKMVSAPIAT